jgi:hypothetical protein
MSTATKKMASSVFEWHSPFISKPVRVRPNAARLQDGRIVWSLSHDRAKRGQEHDLSGTELLEEFAALKDAGEGQLLSFATKYGSLGLCKHGAALGHRAAGGGRCFDLGYSADDFNRERWVYAPETVEAWTQYVTRAHGILSVATKLHRNERALENEWRWLWSGYGVSEHEVLNFQRAVSKNQKQPDLQSFLNGTRILLDILEASYQNPALGALVTQRLVTLADQKRALACTVNHWLDECETGVCISWSGGEVDLRLGLSHPEGMGNRLLIAIGVQLLGAVAKQDAWAFCSACGALYPPRRQPRARENHYCNDCGKTAANRMAQRRYRTRQVSRKDQKK